MLLRNLKRRPRLTQGCRADDDDDGGGGGDYDDYIAYTVYYVTSPAQSGAAPRDQTHYYSCSENVNIRTKMDK
jgi:hypothetical protein